MEDKQLLQCEETCGELKTCMMDCSTTSAEKVQRKPKNGDQSQTKKKVTDLSRNLLIILCEFLHIGEVLRIATSNSILHKKLDWQGPQEQLSHDNASYIKRRGTITLQTFFFQQFPSADTSFYKRMNGLIMRNSYFSAGGQKDKSDSGTFVAYHNSDHNISKESSYQQNNGLAISRSSYLPFIKQSSICEEKLLGIVSPPCMQKQDSFNPFEIAVEPQYVRRSTVTTAFTDQFQEVNEANSCKPSYLQNLFDKWRDMYMEARENIQIFVDTHNQAFYTAFLQDSKAFAREIFLDPSQCENPRFALPQLIRENFHQKGLWYRTEKILVQNFSNCFQRSTVEHTKNVLWELSQRLQNDLAKDEQTRSVLVSLLFLSPTKNDGDRVAETTEFYNHLGGIAMEDVDLITSLPTPQITKGNEIYVNLMAPLSFGKIQDLTHQIPCSLELPDTQPLLLPQPKQATAFDLCQPSLDIEDLDLDNLEVPSIPSLSALRQPTTAALPQLNFNNLQPMQLTKNEFKLPSCEPLFPLPSLSKGNFNAFEMVGLDSTNRIFTGKEKEITQMYKDISSYMLRQFKLLCRAHRWQLQFVLEQIKLAPAVRRSFYPFLEDYVEKERNLRYMLRKLSQNFILQEAFTETMLRENVFQAKETQKQPYLCDFLLLEFLDSMWINEIYRNQRLNLWKIVKQEIEDVHTIERFKELEDKKPVIKKIVNLIHQTEFNLESNFDFLSISNVSNDPKLEANNGQFLQVPSSGNTNQRSSFASQMSHNTSQGVKIYEDLSKHIKVSVERLLKSMSEKSNSISEFMDYCTEYEKFEFHKFMETDYFYLKRKKHYLGIAFANEFSMKLENNKFIPAKGSNNSTTSTVASSENGSVSPPISPSTHKNTSSSQYQNLSLTQIMHVELNETFFHHLLRRILRENKYKVLLGNDEMMHSLFVLFHIEQNSRSQFASDINKYMIKINSDVDELITKYPEVLELDQTNDVEEVLKIVKGECTDDACLQHGKMGGIITGADPLSFEDTENNNLKNGITICPSSLIDCQLSAEDELLLLNALNTQKEHITLSRGYSEQKRDYFMSLSSIIFEAFTKQELEFDFKKLIEEERTNERKRVMDEITQRIENYNQALYQFNQNQQPTTAAANNDQDGDVQSKTNKDQEMEDLTENQMPNEPPVLSQLSGSSPSHFMLDEDEELKIDGEGLPKLPNLGSFLQRFNTTTSTTQQNTSDEMPLYKLLSSNKQQTFLKPMSSAKDQTNTAAMLL